MTPATTIRCSGLARPMGCPGFLLLKNLPVSPTNAAAEEGTAAGELFRAMLEQKTTEPVVGLQASNGVYFDDQMRFHLKPIAEDILNRAGDGLILCETRIDWMTRSGILISGSYDLSYIKNGVLFVEDLKYGWGIVEVKNNWQLIAYTIGELLRRQESFNAVCLTIHQPRPHHEEGCSRRWLLQMDQIWKLKEEIEHHLLNVVAGDAPLMTGKHCKYCPAAAQDCPALNRSFYASIDHVMNEFIQDSMSPAEISSQWTLIDRVSDVMKVKKDSLEALATNRIKEGQVIPGYTLEQSYGHRSWAPGISPDVIETLTGRSVIEKSIMSPAKAEKIGVSKELVKTLTTRPFTGNKLVPSDNSAVGNKIFGNTQPNQIKG